MSKNKFVAGNGSICVSDIPKELYQTGKNGKKYLNFDWILGEGVKFGTHGSISLPQSEEEQTAKARKNYIGNLKGRYSSIDNFEFEKDAEKVVAEEEDDDLPF